MNNAWSWYITIGAIATMLACFWLVYWTNRQRATKEEIKESEAHVWDGELRELNNPLPMWWLYLFVLTLIWGGLYFVFYPGLGNFGGLKSWSSASQYEAEVAAAEAKYEPIFARYGAQPIETLAADPEALDVGRSLFANYCTQCHGSGGLGAPGFPNLTDGVWSWGGTPADIEATILHGRRATMPSLAALFPDEQSIDTMVEYVLSMQDGMDTSSPAHATYTTVCIACHGPDGGGNPVLGAPSLADDNWLYGSSPVVIRKTILEGRNGTMPAHANFLGSDRVHLLAAYVYSLSR
ncbi:MAG TPA: cytochrome-c oxidase, cbb3-type subunit III [Woeseiaceae bacterium]|jgi:cytochrome c oxidase cbb3-type subunit 3|nr:cytochrome-c oxidase, cbb3-type subunit III [Woeseiaceae bacterium]